MRWPMLLIILFLVACGSSGKSLPISEGDEAMTPALSLPPPDLERAFAQTLERRRSVREFTGTELHETELSQLLWAAQGITGDAGQRTAPSAGAIYPLELYVVTPSGSFHYRPAGHVLDIAAAADLRAPLATAAHDQSAVADAPAVVVITGVYERTEAKYGDRAVRYVQLEAGHCAQNLLLQAVDLGLGAVPIGAFSGGEVQDVLDLPADHRPLYLIPIGHPA